MTVDPTADRPVYQQVADIYRDRIHRGALQPGQLLPSEQQMVGEFGIGRTTARQALAVLRGEGLIVTVPRRGTVVRAPADAQVVVIGPDEEVSARMPSAIERRRMGISEGVPVFVVASPGGEEQVYPADRTRLRAAPAGEATTDRGHSEGT